MTEEMEEKEKSRELIDLQKQWYKKLEDAGFSDIEVFDENMEPHNILRRPSYTLYLKIKDRYLDEEMYYTCASRLLHTGLLPEKDYHIWELFCEGYTHKQIVKSQKKSHRAVYLSLKRSKALLLEYIKTRTEEEFDEMY